jgi:hypothetical protein
VRRDVIRRAGGRHAQAVRAAFQRQ